MSSRPDRRHTSTNRNRVSANRARSLSLDPRGPSGQANSLTMPGSGAFQRSVLACICPFCGAGPFKILATHVHRKHDVDARELRDMAGLTYSTPITSPEFHAERSARSREMQEQGVSLRPEHVAKGRHNRKSLSRAAVAGQRAKGDVAREKHPDLIARAAQAGADATRDRLMPEYRAAAEAYDAEFSERGRRYGTMRATAERLGWPFRKVQLRLHAAWGLGLGIHRGGALPPTQ